MNQNEPSSAEQAKGNPAQKIKVSIVIFQFVRWKTFEWEAQHFDRKKFELHYVLLFEGKSPMVDPLEKLGIPYTAIQYCGPEDREKAVGLVDAHCRTVRPDIVHTHFQPACLAGLLGACQAGIPIRIHTRHHAGPYPAKEKSPAYRFYDNVINQHSTHILAISNLVMKVLQTENTEQQSKHFVTHGFDLDSFREVPQARVDKLRAKYLGGHDGPVIGVVARYASWKGVHYIIPAFKKVLEEHPNAKLILANAWGPYNDEIQELLGEVPNDNYIEIPYENDSSALFKLFDVFVHAPMHETYEAYGQVYTEALASGIPSVFTQAGITMDWADEKRMALFVPHQDSEGLFKAISSLLKDAALREELQQNGWELVQKRCGIETHMRALQQVYLDAYEQRGEVHERPKEYGAQVLEQTALAVKESQRETISA